MHANTLQDLNFSFVKRNNGEVIIKREGKVVTKLRGKQAARFVESAVNLDFEDQQQLMARFTGNYKRGNERQARQHNRNK